MRPGGGKEQMRMSIECTAEVQMGNLQEPCSYRTEIQGYSLEVLIEVVDIYNGKIT